MNCPSVLSFTWVVLMLMTVTAIGQESGESHKLTVDVANIKDKGGQIVISLYKKKDGFPDNPKKAEQSFRNSSEIGRDAAWRRSFIFIKSMHFCFDSLL